MPASGSREHDGPQIRWGRVTTVMSTVPPIADQAERLIALNLHRVAGVSEDRLRTSASRMNGTGVLAIRHDLAPPSALVPALCVGGRNAFVVADMTDVDEFAPLASIALPDAPVYVIRDPDRGDDMANWSPDEALPTITRRGRTPLTLTEGLHWLLQRPEVLERGHCFMTIGSRRAKADGSLDTRTPAVWISNGTGRDGPANRNAPKIGWCWAGNRHTWLGLASAAGRDSTPD